MIERVRRRCDSLFRKDRLKERIRTLEIDKKELSEKNQVLIETLKSREKEAEVVKAPIIVPMDAKSFLLTASKESVFLPNGHRGFREMKFLISENSNRLDNNVEVIRYITTEGGFAYLYTGEYWSGSREEWVHTPKWKGHLLMEEMPEKETRIYESLQHVMRQRNKVILKVTFPETKTREEVAEFIGMRQRLDPKVEVVFE